jgi:hypothetical protein
MVATTGLRTARVSGSLLCVWKIDCLCVALRTFIGLSGSVVGS